MILAQTCGVEDFTGSAVADQPIRRSSNIPPEFEARVRQLVADWGAEKSPELIEELIITALKMARDKMGTGDLKLMNRSLKELRYAAKIFAPYRDVRKVVVFGSARTAPSEPEAQQAEEFGRQMVTKNYMVITGGGDGIMGAAQRGAGRENSFGLNIRLPFEQRANEIIHGDPKLINFNYFFTRKLNFVKETHAYALFPGGFGTMDEGFEALTLMQTGKALIIPIVLIDRPDGSYWETWMRFLTDHLLKLGLISKGDFNFIKIAHDVKEAVDHILLFYRNYQSSRWVDFQLVLRMNKQLTNKALVNLNTAFADILRAGKIEQRGPLPQEKNQPEIWDLPRLVLSPHRHEFGRYRQLIDAINLAETR
ncbi:MAG: TIGR00730 family Rossman fold protein [Chthoniobacterales bacterium]|nr:TIGR00730 family Rossman fold protein [Chthoniobacterales bacterium]